MLGWGMGEAIAAPAQTEVAQNTGVCRQHGPEYRDVYSFDTEGYTVTVCQKGKEYYYVKSVKAAQTIQSGLSPENTQK
jgi:hypothetical protein